jgi:hypothetical protein
LTRTRGACSHGELLGGEADTDGFLPGRAAEMTLADVVRLNVYTTDVDELFEQSGRLAERLGTPAAASRRPCSALPDSQHHSSSSPWRRPQID